MLSGETSRLFMTRCYDDIECVEHEIISSERTDIVPVGLRKRRNEMRLGTRVTVNVTLYIVSFSTLAVLS